MDEKHTRFCRRGSRDTDLMVETVEMLPLIHSIVVVTSPMGDQAPPELAAMTTTAPRNLRNSASFGTSLRRRLT